MKQRRKVEWTRLDNASKIFPATYNEKDTKVFRVSCELTDPIAPEILQSALDLTIESFPLFQSILRRGFFWYYFEATEVSPVVQIEHDPVCGPIYRKDHKNLLFRVSYYHNRVNVEIFHALSDGTGAIWFIQTLMHHYLVLRYPEVFAEKEPELKVNISVGEKMNDSFGRHFTGENTFLLPKRRPNQKNYGRAYRIKGNRIEENRMKLIEGCMSTEALLTEARKDQTTLTVLVTSLFFYAIQKDMTARGKRYPVVFSIPINLRQFFESGTVRNFFSTFHVGYHFKKEPSRLEEIIASVNQDFKKELTEERLNGQLNKLISLEKNPLAKVIPLPLKDISLRIANKIKDRGITAAISNVGLVTMPAELEPYIRQFSFCTAARRPQITMCSYGDRLVISFTSPFRETEIQRIFFETLAKRGISIEISSN